jgi:hypothetical protein
MDIHEATRSYEDWLAQHTPVVGRALARKHALMADRWSVFPFLRGTFYRWLQRFPKVCPDLAGTPRLLAVGDLHAANFGVWRDAEGRLAWGVNDFDEACVIGYANDPVRLATSLLIADKDERLGIRPREACDAVLAGYRRGIEDVLRGRARPYVLGADNDWLTDLADERTTTAFWPRFIEHLIRTARSLPRGAAAALDASRPKGCQPWRVYARDAGVGSLGRPRLCGVAEFQGGPLVREAKSIVPSAMVWHSGPEADQGIAIRKIISTSIRAPDPFLRVEGGWIVRRIAADSRKIELEVARDHGKLELLCEAMGRETANVHAGSRRALRSVERDLGRRGRSWLYRAAKAMADDVRSDWKDWRGRV